MNTTVAVAMAAVALVACVLTYIDGRIGEHIVTAALGVAAGALAAVYIGDASRDLASDVAAFTVAAVAGVALGGLVGNLTYMLRGNPTQPTDGGQA